MLRPAKVLAVIGYYSGLCSFFYRINRKAKRIITFHNVMPDCLMEGLPDVGCMDKVSDFEKIVNEVNKRFRFSTEIFDARTATITFDDGLLSQYEIAGRILKDRNIPAILFQVGNAMGVLPESTLITEKVILWLEFTPWDVIEKAFGKFASRNEFWVKVLQPSYRADAANRGAAFLEKLNVIYPLSKIMDALPSEWKRLRLSGITSAQLDDLRARGWKIGWHTKSHFPLGCLSDEEKRRELNSPPEYRDVVLSYPYGDIGAIGESSLSIAEVLGYPCAVSNDPDYSPHRGRFFLQRMALSPNKYELHFVLSGLKYFIKYRKLLPVVGQQSGKI